MTALLVPYTSGDPHRDRNWSWLHARYTARYPDWPITIGTCTSPWCKATAVTDALNQTDDDIVIIADADVWCDGLPEAVAQVESGAATWAMPHRRVHRLTDEATQQFMVDDTKPIRLRVEEPPYVGAPAGGILVIRRDTASDIPLDPRFVGWGGEDRAWGQALRLLAGSTWRGRAALYHLWHPPQPRRSRNFGNETNEALKHRYRATRQPDAMRALLAEIGERNGTTRNP